MSTRGGGEGVEGGIVMTEKLVSSYASYAMLSVLPDRVKDGLGFMTQVKTDFPK